MAKCKSHKDCRISDIEFLMCDNPFCVLGSERYGVHSLGENFNRKVCSYCESKLKPFPNKENWEIIS